VQGPAREYDARGRRFADEAVPEVSWSRASNSTVPARGMVAPVSGPLPRPTTGARHSTLTIAVVLAAVGILVSIVAAANAGVVVGNTDDESGVPRGVYLRTTPIRVQGTLGSGDVIEPAQPNGTTLTVVGPPTLGGGEAWLWVGRPDGRVGWVPVMHTLPSPAFLFFSLLGALATVAFVWLLRLRLKTIEPALEGAAQGAAAGEGVLASPPQQEIDANVSAAERGVARTPGSPERYAALLASSRAAVAMERRNQNRVDATPTTHAPNGTSTTAIRSSSPRAVRHDVSTSAEQNVARGGKTDDHISSSRTSGTG
jgi:hypothetical protein